MRSQVKNCNSQNNSIAVTTSTHERVIIKKPYSEQIQSPNWQRKRSFIMNRDGFKCRLCGDETTQLHVHHLYYVSGKEIHDYDDECLVTLCRDCHDYAHNELPKMNSILAFAVLLKGLNYIDLCQTLQFKL